ncbi:MAG: FAD-dependent oxidoreductase [Rhodoferax sp.]|nr:FAD-dependent oxidoreductase [Rhodoferax sp.]
MRRRRLLQAAAAGPVAAVLGAVGGCAAPARSAGPRVVVVGGGYGGATAAKYLRMWSDARFDVTLVEPNPAFVSCPLSNLVLGGSRSMADITLSYGRLAQRHGVRIVRDTATAIDPERQQVRLAGGAVLPYDRLVVSPGIDLLWDSVPGLELPGAAGQVLHAWKAGPQTVALRQRLEAMPDGGVFALAIPPAPYRCPPGPYERACQVASYLQRHKPRSKVLVLDANDDITSKGSLFRKAWADRYPGLVEYRPRQTLAGVDVAAGLLRFDLGEDVRASVLNLIPPMRAGTLAVTTGLVPAGRRWCEVDFLTQESRVLPRIHVLGDAIQVAPAMPKSAHMANQHAKTCAAAIVALLTDQPPNALPIYHNTCYSFVSDDAAMHVASVHRYDAAQKTMLPVPGAGGLSAEASVQEGRYAMGWARNIWADTLA